MKTGFSTQNNQANLVCVYEIQNNNFIKIYSIKSKLEINI